MKSDIERYLEDQNTPSRSAVYDLAYDKAVREGHLPEVAAKMGEAANADAVYGVGHKRDREGRPIETGRGAPGRMTETHFVALRKAEGVEAEKAARALNAKFRGA